MLSRTVDFMLSDDEESTSVTALVRGGGGAYDFSWTALLLGDPFADRVDLGSGSQVTLDDARTTTRVRLAKGAWSVIVHVVDRETGAFKHQQQAVFSCPFSQRGEPAFSLPDDETRVAQAIELPPPAPLVS